VLVHGTPHQMKIAHPRLGTIMKMLRPEARPFADFVVQDNSDGNGPYLATNLKTNPVIQKELDAVADAEIDDWQGKKKK